MAYPQILSLLVYIASAVLFSAALLAAPRNRPWWLKGCALALVLASILFVAELELNITSMPFWSRDYSLTWTMMVLALAVSVAYLGPHAHELVGVWLRCRADAAGNTPPGVPKSAGTSSERETVTLLKHSPSASAEPSVSRGRPRISRPLMGLLLTALAICLMAIYLRGAEQNLIRVNTDPERVDQSAYINYAEKILKQEYAHVGNRARMPLYPFLLSFALDPSDDLALEFTRAKYFSVALSLVLLVALEVLFLRLLPPVQASALLVLVAFSLYIFRASYVQAELLNYTLTAFLFVLMIRYLIRPSTHLAVAIGVLAGFTHLAKAAVLPALGLLLLVAFGWAMGNAVREARRGSGRGILSPLLSRLGELAIVAAFFLLVLFPYIKNSWYRFGTPFYNVNSTFYLWYDSWEEAAQGTKAHGDRVGWPDMPESEIPSFSKYVREHDIEDVVDRLASGGSRTIQEAAGSYGYAKYVVLGGLALALAALSSRRLLGEAVRKHPHIIVFLVLYFVGYSILTAWDYEFTDGNRLILALYIPLLLVYATGIRFLLRDRSWEVLGRRLTPIGILYGLLSVVLVLDIRAVTAYRILSMFGGT